MITRSGGAVLVVAVLAVAAGLVLGYPELVGLGAGVAVPVLVAVMGARSSGGLVVARLVSPGRVAVGEAATSLLVVRNEGPRRTRRLHAGETVGVQMVAVDVPALGPGETAPPVSMSLPTGRRGVHTVGPLRFGRPDPFGFAAGTQRDTATAVLTVYPRVHALRPLGAGAARDLDGPTSELSREGGIAFHGLRRYVPGDDVRLIHWRAVARSGTGELVVRQHMETVRPQVVVLVDTNPSSYRGDGFEVAMEAAASIVHSSVESMHPIRLITSDHTTRSWATGEGGDGSLFDQLAGLEPGDTVSLAEAVGSIGVHEPGWTLVIITGSVPDQELAVAGEFGSRFGQVLAVRADPTARTSEVRHVGSLTVLTATGGEQFAQVWNEQLA